MVVVNGCEDLVRLIGPPATTCSLYHVEINQRVGWELNYDIYRRTLVCFVEKFVSCVACSYSYAELRAPAAYEHQLYTSTSCTRVPAVYKHQLYTGASCIRAPCTVHELQLYTITSCTRVPAVYKHQLYTGASCIRAPAGSETVHETLFCIQIPCLNFKGIGKVKMESWATCGPVFEYIYTEYTRLKYGERTECWTDN